MSDDVDRVVVFMDYQNIHGWARRQFLPFGADPSEGHGSVIPWKQHCRLMRGSPA